MKQDFEIFSINKKMGYIPKVFQANQTKRAKLATDKATLSVPGSTARDIRDTPAGLHEGDI
jgi:hypothetical protein